jgi:hypothetical protein
MDMEGSACGLLNVIYSPFPGENEEIRKEKVRLIGLQANNLPGVS